MEFIYEPELLKYMKEKGRYNIIIELITIDHSDIEIADIHVYLANDRQFRLFKEEKKYKSIKTDVGEVLIPRYKFETDEKIVLGLKSFWFFKSLTHKGIRL